MACAPPESVGLRQCGAARTLAAGRARRRQQRRRRHPVAGHELVARQAEQEHLRLAGEMPSPLKSSENRATPGRSVRRIGATPSR